MPKIPHDAPLTDIYIKDPNTGERRRVYHGDTKAHIQWKMHEHRNSKPEKIEVQIPQQGFLEDVGLVDEEDDDEA